TASSRGLADPFNPLEAIHQSAKLLQDLRREFGNLGLAAAAYNAGPGRVRDWLSGRRSLPRETRAYVRLVTGQSAEQWIGVQTGAVEFPAATPVPCRQVAGLFRPPASEAKPTDPWDVELVGSSSDAAALANYTRSTRPSWQAASHVSFTMASRAAAWAGRGSTWGRRAASAPKNCARTCVPPAPVLGAAQLKSRHGVGPDRIIWLSNPDAARCGTSALGGLADVPSTACNDRF